MNFFKKNIFSVIAVLAVSPIAAQNQNAPAERYGIAFYNLENLFDTIPNNPLGRDDEYTPNGKNHWGSKKYWAKINNLAYAISKMTNPNEPDRGPAIIGVSEIENRTVLDDLVKDPQIRKWMLQVVHHDSPDRRGVDVGLLYNPRMFRLLSVNNHRLVIPSNEQFRTRDQMCVTGILAGDTISVIVNHWPSRLGGQEQSSYLREAAAQLSKDIADSLWRINPNMGVIIMGDLNDDPQDRSCAKVLGAKRSADDVTSPHGFYNPFWKKLDDGIGTLAYKGGWNLFDQIIVSGTLLGKFTGPNHLHMRSARVMNFDFLKDTEGSRQGYPLRTHTGGVWLNGYSDHFPTEIFLGR